MKEPSNYLKDLLLDKESIKSKKFKMNIKVYNSIFSFTSMGGKVDKFINRLPSPYVYRILNDGEVGESNDGEVDI